MKRGKLHHTDGGWIVMFNKKIEHTMVGYHDYKTTTVYEQLPLHPDDVNQIDKDAQVFDNIEARISAFPDVEFDIITIGSKDDLMGKKYAKILENKVSRIEVIDENGRGYVKYFDGEYELSYQDDGRTLKIFIKPNKK
jgi:hypothetical protein